MRTPITVFCCFWLAWLALGFTTAVAEQPEKISVAVYDDAGATSSKEKLIVALGKSDKFQVERLKAEEIRAGKTFAS